jgi:hypothetical protein
VIADRLEVGDAGPGGIEEGSYSVVSVSRASRTELGDEMQLDFGALDRVLAGGEGPAGGAPTVREGILGEVGDRPMERATLTALSFLLGRGKMYDG